MGNRRAPTAWTTRPRGEPARPFRRPGGIGQIDRGSGRVGADRQSSGIFTISSGVAHRLALQADASCRLPKRLDAIAENAGPSTRGVLTGRRGDRPR